MTKFFLVPSGGQPVPPMTAREFAERFKPYLPVRRIAADAGIKEATWYGAVTRDRTLTDDERRRLRAAVEAHADEIRRIAGELEPNK